MPPKENLVHSSSVWWSSTGSGSGFTWPSAYKAARRLYNFLHGVVVPTFNTTSHQCYPPTAFVAAAITRAHHSSHQTGGVHSRPRQQPPVRSAATLAIPRKKEGLFMRPERSGTRYVRHRRPRPQMSSRRPQRCPQRGASQSRWPGPGARDPAGTWR